MKFKLKVANFTVFHSWIQKKRTLWKH